MVHMCLVTSRVYICRTYFLVYISLAHYLGLNLPYILLWYIFAMLTTSAYICLAYFKGLYFPSLLIGLYLPCLLFGFCFPWSPLGFLFALLTSWSKFSLLTS